MRMGLCALYIYGSVFVIGDMLWHMFTSVLLLKVILLYKVCLHAQEPSSDSGERGGVLGEYGMIKWNIHLYVPGELKWESALTYEAWAEYATSFKL